MSEGAASDVILAASQAGVSVSEWMRWATLRSLRSGELYSRYGTAHIGQFQAQVAHQGLATPGVEVEPGLAGGYIKGKAASTSEFSPKKSPASPKSSKGDPSEGGVGEKTQEKPHFSPVEVASPLLSAEKQADEAQGASRSVKSAEMPTNLKPSQMQAWKRAHRP